MSKKTVAIIFGGCSPEYEVSLNSSFSIINAIDREKYDVILIGITKQGVWFRYTGLVEDIPADKWHTYEAVLTRAFISPERGIGLVEVKGGDVVSIPVDVVFPMLHGRFGEDGTIQGLCELAGIPCVGSGAAASALCMDKSRAHKLVSAEGIKVPKSVCFEYVPTDDEILSAAEDLGLPVYVKPVKAGSSFGISKVENAAALVDAVKLAFFFDDAVIIEESIGGFEARCSVLGNNKLTVGRVDEIELSEGFFTFEEKYTLKTAKIHLPARVSEEMEKRITDMAKLIYKTLGCRGYCRIDVFVTKNNEIIFNEANTIPGFTDKSGYPKMMREIGIEFPQLLDKLIELSLENV